MTKTVSERKCISNLEKILQKRRFTHLVGEQPSTLKIEVQRIKLPDQVSGRLYLLYDIVEHLQFTYDDEGIRRWFDRNRTELENKSPSQYLGPSCDAKGEYAQRVLALAKSLRG